MHGPHMHNQSGHTMSSMKKASFEVVLKSKQQIAEGTMAFIFEKPEGLKFKAGQHIRMTLINPPETDSEGNSRFFSLANTPQDTDLVIAMRMRDTAFKRVLGNMEIGKKVLIQILLDVPHGAFALHDDPAKPAVMIAGGIGIVPLYSMIKDATERKLSHKITLFYSNRRPEDVPFLNELKQLAQQNSYFSFVPTMTEVGKSMQAWQGETGKIDQAMIKKYVSNPQAPIYYLAGLPEMTNAMKALLTNLSVSEDSINAEEFTGFNLNEMASAQSFPWKRHILIAVIGLMILLGVIAHAGIIASISKNGIPFNNPFLYIMIALMLALVAFKFKHVRHWRKK